MYLRLISTQNINKKNTYFNYKVDHKEASKCHEPRTDTKDHNTIKKIYFHGGFI